MDEPALYRLLTWLSPGFPVGAYSYSHGLEWAVEAGEVASAEDLHAWLVDVLAHGGGFADAVLCARAHAAAAIGEPCALAEVAELGAALSPSAERHLETTAQGRAFLEAAEAAWPGPGQRLLRTAWAGPFAYPVAVGAVAAGHGIALAPALTAFVHAFAANLVSAGMRLVPLGQSAGQRVIAALEPVVGEVARRAASAPLEAAGGCAALADIASMRHETQYTRLFRS